LHVERNALDAGKIVLKPAGDLVGARVTLSLGLERNKDAALIGGDGRAAGADLVGDRGHGRVFQHHLDRRFHTLRHGRKRSVLSGLGDAEDHPGILLREEAFGDDHIEIAGERDRAQHHSQGDGAMPQRDFQPSLVDGEQPIEAAFEHAVQEAVLPALGLEHVGAHHWRERARDQQREHERDTHRHCEFAEQ
jgi:hypothetical protein